MRDVPELDVDKYLFPSGNLTIAENSTKPTYLLKGQCPLSMSIISKNDLHVNNICDACQTIETLMSVQKQSHFSPPRQP